ncbi:NADH-quinone oxidoreductase subunit 5 family protein [Salinisphaera orenii]|uniref:NADH-quinone oxidoreductase subunit 5 family protein n=1 Tax=Salinisphaera orenii TaxID=856731 RepID=UPI000DBE6C33
MLWALPLIPLLAGLGLFLGAPERRATLTWVAVATAAVTLVLALAAVTGGWQATLVWSPTLQLHAVLPPVAAVMAVLVPAVALPVVLYAGVHEAGQGLARLLALLLAFVGAMELLVIAGDWLTLLIGWELVGACSWALIGHHWRDAANPQSGRYAFVTTRLGDLGLFLAAMAAFAGTGSLAFADLGGLDGAWLELVAIGVVVSAAAKSGQVPFSPWLFRAMAGPNSVSALLHAATMVAAGAYLLIRLQPELAALAWFGPTLLATGLATALAGGLVAVLQDHAKKLAAASTTAQFGLMFVAVGAGYPLVALTYLVAHAAFKALLFMAAGSAGARAGTYQLAEMGVGRSLPVVAGATAVAALALAGVPPLGAAWGKEAIIAAAGHVNPMLAIGTVVAGGFSAAYAARFYLLAFGGSDTDQRDNRWWEIAPIILLAAVTVLLSLLWLPGAESLLAERLGVAIPRAPVWETAASLVAVAVGLYTGRWLARQYAAIAEQPIAGAAGDWLGLPRLIQLAIVAPTEILARWAADADDTVVDALPRGVAAFGLALARLGGRAGEWLADGLAEGSARLVGFGGTDSRRLQTGLSHHYYALITVGFAALLVIALFWN